jgi:hypothetical protein
MNPVHLHLLTIFRLRAELRAAPGALRLDQEIGLRIACLIPDDSDLVVPVVGLESHQRIRCRMIVIHPRCRHHLALVFGEGRANVSMLVQMVLQLPVMCVQCLGVAGSLCVARSLTGFVYPC